MAIFTVTNFKFWRICLVKISVGMVCQGPLNGGVSNGGVSRSGLVLPFLSFVVLFRTFPIFLGFPDLRGDGPGIFPICPFPLSQPIKSTYEEQSRKGLRHNLDLSRKSGTHPGLETPRFSFSQLWGHRFTLRGDPFPLRASSYYFYCRFRAWCL